MKNIHMRAACVCAILLGVLLTLIACASSDEPDQNTESDTPDFSDPITEPTSDTAPDASESESIAEVPTESLTEPVTEATTPEVTEEETEPVTEPETLSGAEKLAEILLSKDSLIAPAKQIGFIKHNGVSNISQGGYTDGTYHYQLHIQKDTASNEENNVVRLIKYDIAAETIVKISDPLPLNHANDLTYNPKRGVFVAVHNNPHREWVSFIDPETLTITETVTLDFKIFSLDYNESRDQYVAGVAGGQTFRFLNADLKPVSDTVYDPTPLTTGYVTQGVACDDSFIYFVLWRENVITVYDWDGQFVTLISLKTITDEPENISVVDGEIYIGVGTGSGTKLYQIIRYK